MKYLLTSIIGLILGVWIATSWMKPEVVTTTETITLYDTTKVEIPVPYEVTILDVIEIPVPQDVDTTAILADYFSKNVYNRVWEDDDLKVELIDTVSLNRLSTGTLSYSILKPSVINTTTNTYISRFITIEALLPILEPYNIGFKASYVGDRVYSLTIRPQSQTFEIGLGWKIKHW